MKFLSPLLRVASVVVAFALVAGTAHASEQLYLAVNDPQHYHHSNCSLLRVGATIVEADRAKTLAPCPICKPTIEDTTVGVGAATPAPTATPMTPRPTATASPATTASGSTSKPSKVTTSSSGGAVHVKGYYKKDGTYVKPHTRKKPRPKK